MNAAVFSSRIIPACAGQTEHAGDHLLDDTDHPRLCGANVHTQEVLRDTAGSSPLVRGKHGIASMGVLSQRIIPACAGQTVRRRCSPL